MDHAGQGSLRLPGAAPLAERRAHPRTDGPGTHRDANISSVAAMTAQLLVADANLLRRSSCPEIHTPPEQEPAQQADGDTTKEEGAAGKKKRRRRKRKKNNGDEEGDGQLHQ